jgi:rhodanese-related sulfurtransferase
MARALKDFVDEALSRIGEIEPEEVLALEGAIILDVREPEEFAAGHIPGAINIPRGFLEVKADLVHPKKDDRLADRGQKILCFCGGGHRSALAAATLQEMGFDSPLSIRGGWTLWTQKELPTE